MEVWGDKEGVWNREGRKGEERRQREREMKIKVVTVQHREVSKR